VNKKKKRTTTRKAPQHALDFNDLPEQMQLFFAEQADGLREFRELYPRLYDVMFRPMDSKRYRRFEARMISAQQKLRKRDLQ
jgi:hypothetical protein